MKEKTPQPYSDRRVMTYNFIKFFLPMAFTISLMYLGHPVANVTAFLCAATWPHFYRSLKVISDEQSDLLQRLAVLDPLRVRPFLNEIDQRHRAIFHGEYVRLTRWFLSHHQDVSESNDSLDQN